MGHIAGEWWDSGSLAIFYSFDYHCLTSQYKQVTHNLSRTVHSGIHLVLSVRETGLWEAIALVVLDDSHLVFTPFCWPLPFDPGLTYDLP